MELKEELKQAIWKKGVVDEKYPSDQVRKDACGAFMLYDRFCDRSSIFGWEIDHIYPASVLIKKGVPMEKIDDLINLRPINWRNNESKGANYPYYSACLKADDEEATNVETDEGKVVNQQLQEVLKDFFELNK